MLALLIPGVGMGGSAGVVVVAAPLFVHRFDLAIYRGPQRFDMTFVRSHALNLTVVRSNEFDLTLEE